MPAEQAAQRTILIKRGSDPWSFTNGILSFLEKNRITAIIYITAIIALAFFNMVCVIT